MPTPSPTFLSGWLGSRRAGRAASWATLVVAALWPSGGVGAQESPHESRVPGLSAPSELLPSEPAARHAGEPGEHATWWVDSAASTFAPAGPTAGLPAGGPPLNATAGAPCVGVAAFATHGQPVPGGGTLSPLAGFNPATLDASGRMTFMAQVDGSPRNQGIFVSDGVTLTPIAMGCGGGGGSGVPGSGCGDPSPIGGTFSGFFAGTIFAPAINAAGDVLFFADVDGGSAPRGLFLHHAGSGLISKVAAVGDPSPIGGVFGAVGPGSLNDSGVVVFLAAAPGTTNSSIFRWSGGVLTKVAALGDAAPGGGTFSLLGTESLGFVDGTDIPAGPVPGINAAGQVSFRAILSTGGRGLIVSTGGVHQFYVKDGDVTPAGGTYFDFQAASINAAGQIAFFADWKPTPTTFSAGWFAGAPGGWREAMSFNSPLDDGALCFGLAFSRNPMTPLDGSGNLLVWTDAKLPNNSLQERLVVCAADGTSKTVARQGDPTPIGGSNGSLQPWVSMNAAAEGTLSCYTPGAAGGVLNAHFLLSSLLTWQDLGAALAGGSGLPQLVGAGTLAPGSAGSLSLSSAKPNAPVYVLIGLSPVFQPFHGGTLVPSVDLKPLLLTTNGTGQLTLSWSSWPAGLPSCTEFYLQEWIIDPAGPQGAAASNGLLARTP